MACSCGAAGAAPHALWCGQHLPLVAFEDGFRPGAAPPGTVPRIADVSRLRGRSSGAFVVVPEALPDRLAGALYRAAALETAARTASGSDNKKYQGAKPWGVYVSMGSVAAAEELGDGDGDGDGDGGVQAWRERLAALAVRHLLGGAGVGGAELEHAVGAQAWCLAADAGSQVQYHIDYAELHRHETNTTVPPLFAGTVQVSDVGEDASGITGGAFAAHTGGLDHYRRTGYKAQFKGGDPGLRTTADGAGTAPDPAADGPGTWRVVPYRYNQGILHDGDFPHLSLPIERLRPGLRRVIIGINVFSGHVEEVSRRAPEHSDAFNRTIKLYQTAAALGKAGGSGGGGKLTVERLRENPAMARLLVLAARQAKKAGVVASRQPPPPPAPVGASDRAEFEALLSGGDVVVGQQCQALYRGYGKHWYDVTLAAADRAAATFVVVYDDGERWESARACAVRRKP